MLALLIAIALLAATQIRGINEQTNNLRNAVLDASRPEESKADLGKVSQATRDLVKIRDELAALEDGGPAVPLLTALRESSQTHASKRQREVVLLQANLPDAARNFQLDNPPRSGRGHHSHRQHHPAHPHHYRWPATSA